MANVSVAVHISTYVHISDMTHMSESDGRVHFSCCEFSRCIMMIMITAILLFKRMISICLLSTMFAYLWRLRKNLAVF
jgi:hypothetical protein